MRHHRRGVAVGEAMSEMVERVADHLRLCGLEQNAEYFARKAIEAMREPTHMAWPESISEYWRAAIDEALR